MRIVIASGMYPPHGGGAERATELLAEGLVGLGHEVTVLASSTQSAAETVNGVKVVRIDACGCWIGDLIRRPFAHRALWNAREVVSRKRAGDSFAMIASLAPELVITGNIKGLGGCLPRRLRELPAPHVHVVHDFEPVEPTMLRPGETGQGLTNDLWSAVSRWRWGSPELAVFPSSWLRGLVASHGVFPDSETIVLANPIRSLPAARSRRREREGCRLLFVGALEPHKGALWLVTKLLSAAPSESWSLDVVGDGGERAELEAIARKDGRIRVHGPKVGSELEPFWDAADALVVPSRCLENSPLVIAEASARRVPVLAADVGGIPESVFPEENGWLFDPEDDASFLAALESACSSEARSALGWKKTPETLSPEAYAKAILAALPVKAPRELRLRCVDCGGRVEESRCADCRRAYGDKDGVLDLRPRKMSEWKREEAEYHDKAVADARETHQLDAYRNLLYHRRAISRLRPVAPGGWVAELAGGSGFDGALALRAGLKVFESDISESAARLARRALSAVEGSEGRFVCAVADAEAIPLADRSLAGAIMVASLHHAEDPDKVLAEALRALVPGARFVAAVEPNRLWFSVLNRLKPTLEHALEKRKAKSVADEEHDGFTAGELAGRLSAAGFTDVRVEPVWLLAGCLHYKLEFLTRLFRRERRFRAPLWVEKALVATDEFLFRIPGVKHLAWHWIASGRAGKAKAE